MKVSLGYSNYPGYEEKRIVLPVKMFMRHVFVAGKSGAGKTTWLLNNMLSLISLLEKNPEEAPGFTFFDPHGDGIETLLTLIPPSLHDRVHILPTGLTEFPRGFNFLEIPHIHDAEKTVSEFVNLLQVLFPGQTGPRMEHFLRNGLLTLLQAPPQTIVGVQPLFSDEVFREQILSYVNDPVLQRFWDMEFSAVAKKIADVIGPIWNKVGALTLYKNMRRILGQPRSTIRIREIMDKGHILLVDGSGCGPDERKLLLGMLIVKFHFAAQGRKDIPFNQRRPHIVYMDEVHGYAVPTIEKILAEDRKYGLGLVLSTQYLEQMPAGILQGIMGNINTYVILRLGLPNAKMMSQWLKPEFNADDLINIPDLNAVVKTVGEGGHSLIATVKNPIVYEGDPNNRSVIYQLSNERDGKPALEVDLDIERMYPNNLNTGIDPFAG